MKMTHLTKCDDETGVTGVDVGDSKMVGLQR